MYLCAVTGRHIGFSWDGYFEHCKCGASAGDRRHPVTGQRYTFFEEWSTS